MSGVGLKTKGIEGVDSLLDKLSGVIKNPKPLLARLSIIGFKDIISHFSEEMGPDGPWVELSPVTIKLRRKGRTRKKTRIRKLQDSGVLRNSLIPGKGLTSFEGTRVILRTPIKYASLHQHGGTIKFFGKKTVTVPARPFMWFSEKARRRMKKIAVKFVREAG